MLKSNALKHFGTGLALARALGITGGAISQWGDVVPYASAKRIAEMVPSLYIDPSMYDRQLKPKPLPKTKSRKRAA
jgi:hypothetical protein